MNSKHNEWRTELTTYIKELLKRSKEPERVALKKKEFGWYDI